MHHGEEMSEKMRGEMNEQIQKLARELELGATGQHPQGQLDETDEGEIRLGVTSKDGKVVIAFGKPVAWFGMDPRQARALAESIRQASYRAEGK
jgi:hypothetical protein